MSPRVGMAIDVAAMLPASDRPLDRLRAAVRMVEAQRLRVALASLGIHGAVRSELGGYHRTWVLESPRSPRVVSLVGAVLLALQPIEIEGDHPEAVAAAALDVSTDWLLGVLDGWEGDPQVALLTGPSAELYRDGLRSGAVLWVEFTNECQLCGERRYHKDSNCSGCLARRSR